MEVYVTEEMEETEATREDEAKTFKPFWPWSALRNTVYVSAHYVRVCVCIYNRFYIYQY